MIDWMYLLKLSVSYTGKLHLYGDSNQIGLIDSSNTPGYRHTLSILDFCYQVGSVNVYNTVKRFGEPLFSIV